ncbi:heat shock factor protein 5-like isoform X3 [Motacilla alba alba]|uniref:heat shock factor protein 5-like isoform X3 n=1 Tax=Motacilla alba alba TaxID=1094192 RepID=UPI0018D50D45|nr:heat shock factor protein 5-like isoform X3 [Motacilla alba alba]
MAELPLPAGLSASTFPAKLWRLVNSPRVRSVRWDSRAQGLLVDRCLFERELLSAGDAHGADAEGGPGPVPDSFQATHFGSFVRQLNLYGFRKVPGWVGSDEPGDAGGWLHFRNPNFRRDRPDLLLRIKRLTRANRQRLAAGLEVRSRQPSRFQQLHTERAVPSLPAGQPPRAATPAGIAGFAAWTAPSWLWNTPGEEELPPPDLDMVLETLEEMFSLSAQGNIHVAPESSGGEPVDRAAAEGALPGTKSCGNNSQEPEELDIHLIYLARRAALREKKDQRESL